MRRTGDPAHRRSSSVRRRRAPAPACCNSSSHKRSGFLADPGAGSDHAGIDVADPSDLREARPRRSRAPSPPLAPRRSWPARRRGDATVTSPAPRATRPRRQSGRACGCHLPDTTTAWPRAYLCPSICGTGNDAPPKIRDFFEGCGTICPAPLGDSDVGDTHAAAMDAARQQQVAGLAAEERHRLGRAHRAPIIAPVSPLMPLGRSMLSTGTAAGVDCLDHARGSPLTGRLRPGAEQRVDDQRGRADRRRIARQHRPVPTRSQRSRRRLSAFRGRTAASPTRRGPRGEFGARRRSRRRHCCRVPRRPGSAPSLRESIAAVFATAKPAARISGRPNRRRIASDRRGAFPRSSAYP